MDQESISQVIIDSTRFSGNIAGMSFSRNKSRSQDKSNAQSGGALFLGPQVNGFIPSCVFRDNFYCELKAVQFDGNRAQNGGAISSVQTSSLEMISVSFIRNIAESGGALYAMLECGQDLQQTRKPNFCVFSRRSECLSPSEGPRLVWHTQGGDI